MGSEKPLPHIEFRKILYATDLSESGREAFPYAASLARHCGAALTVFHVVETHDFEKYLVGYINDALWEQLKQRSLEEARELLLRRKRPDAAITNSIDTHCRETLAAGEHPYVEYEIAVDMGEPVDKIVAKAEQEGYDLVVIGKHGHGALKGALMGDTAQRVLRRCRKPVLVVEVPPREAD
ncbi:MAG: UspA14 [Pseudomonadota bacterium]|jgi:nucleotide-binding universal stress UspA family protein